LLESAHDLKSAIESGDWASVAMGSVGTALDALSMAMDPFGAALAADLGHRRVARFGQRGFRGRVERGEDRR
jgi:hypothetical protein